MEGGLLSSPEFAAFAGSVVLFLHNTSVPLNESPLSDEAYPRLVVEKGFSAVPTLCLMDREGKVLAELLRHDVGSLTALRVRAERLVALRDRGAAASAVERRELFLLELELDRIPAAEIAQRAVAWELTDGEKVLVAQKLVDAELVARWRDLSVRVSGEVEAWAYGAAKAGRTPSATEFALFWQLVLEEASRRRDPELAQRAFDGLMEWFCDDRSGWFAWRSAAWRRQLAAAWVR